MVSTPFYEDNYSDVFYDFVTGITASICLPMDKKTYKTGRNGKILESYILQFKSVGFCRHKKTTFKTEFQKLDSRLNIFVVYRT